jgi:hypothetical protein
MATTAISAAHVTQLLENLQEVDLLLDIHRAIAGAKPGRKRDVEVLNKSAVVLVVACWEAYVEDLASNALNFMIDEAKVHTVFPKSVLERVGSKYSGPNAWVLVGDGWKKALRDNFSEVLAKTTGTLNTPRAPQVDDLFAKTLGLAAMSKAWTWSGRTQPAAVKALDELITLRGSIAHRVQHSKSVHKSTVVAAVELISRLAAKSTNQVRNHVHAAVGKYPWNSVTFKGVG